ncbi:hypothetical protein L342_3309 [Escherichia coli CE516]|nr:hypothetical protein HMPREF9535_02140 [Escherichia coli MS 78-1]ESS91647.1 hypothetical protein L342_3309 [Escherichia coli CE516]
MVAGIWIKQHSISEPSLQKNNKTTHKTKTDALWWLLYRAVGCCGLSVCQFTFV